MILCSPSCGVAPNSRSGGEVLERELVTALTRVDADPHVLLARHQLVPPGFPVERLRWGRGLRWWLMPFVMPGGILRCWERHHFQALRAHSALWLGPACEIVSRNLAGQGVTMPWVAHIQHVDRPHPVEGWALRRAARIITISQFSAQQLVDAYANPREKIEVIPPGVDHAAFYRKHYVVGRPAEGRLLFVGGLKARKRPLMLLDILALVPGVTLTVVGDGPLRVAFLREVERRGLGDRVRLYTNVCDELRVTFYRNADVFVFPSSLEGFGMPVLEAMACGVPVVTSQSGALPELVQGVDTAEQMAVLIQALLSDPDFARQTGLENYQRSQAYTWEHTARLVRRVCEGVRG